MSRFKQIRQALSPDAIRQGLAASREALSGDYSGPTEEQLAALTPEQRAAYEEQMARAADAQAQAAAAQRELVAREVARRALFGTAGDHVYGPLPAADAVETATVEQALAASREQFKDVLRNPLGARRPAPPAGTPTGAVDREGQAAVERAARDAAREPYLAPDRPAVSFLRLATRQKTQVEEVAAYLGSSGLSARPDLVFGVYRVPDHIGGGRVLRGGSRVVEWDVVHAAPAQLPPAEPAGSAGFEADEHWVGRHEHQPSVLDEDLALEYLSRAGIGPERCLGVARLLDISDHSSGSGDDGGASYTITQVTGVRVFHPAGAGGDQLDRMRAERPLSLPASAVRIEVLNWGAIANAIHPERHRRHLVPSPFPHLPATAQELLRSWLEIVGLRAEDCYGAQVTEDRPRDIQGVTRKGIFTISTNRGEPQPCADGELRPRLWGGTRVVVVHRDRPEYAAGRERWAAYERDVLEAALSHGTDLRPAVVGPDLLDRGILGKLLRGAEEIHAFVEGYDNHDPFEKIPQYRYCWPPVR